jgi:hypothetical protein
MGWIHGPHLSRRRRERRRRSRPSDENAVYILIRPGEEEPRVGDLGRWRVRLDGVDGVERRVSEAGVGEEFEFPLASVGNLRTRQTWTLEVWLDFHFKLAYEIASRWVFYYTILFIWLVKLILKVKTKAAGHAKCAYDISDRWIGLGIVSS